MRSENWLQNTISVRIFVGKHDNETLREALIESFIEWNILLK
jgi:hypothetical protein